ncbi:MAG: hypothetical protein PVH19_11220 [Planctomycetia bacterium]|jgi:hypothetical protein
MYSTFPPTSLLSRVLAFLFVGILTCSVATADETPSPTRKLFIGTASTSITPDRPVSLQGQARTRIARKVESPVTANVIVLQSRQGNQVLDVAVMVSCDVCSLKQPLIELTRQEIKKRLPELDSKKVFLNATHTHTGPCISVGTYELPKGVMKPEEYHRFFAQRVAGAVEKAWKAQKPGGVSWGLGHAVVAYNRRVVFADGSSKMYGDVHTDRFRKMEGPEDHGVEVLFFWDENRKPIAAAINVPCPAQTVEQRSAINADYWHPVREKLKEKYGKDLCVLGWIGAAGDQSPHFEHRSSWRRDAEERMRKLRGLTRLEEIARRITRAVEDVFEATKSEIHYDVPLVHVTKEVKLPARLVTEEEYAEAKKQLDALKEEKDAAWRTKRHDKVIKRYESQTPEKTYDVELHFLRLGDVAIATNPFELFTDYGIQIKARSKALQTFVIQLAGCGRYLPTADAVAGGGYSAVVQSSTVGPKGGQALVERTVKEINKLWDGKN